MKHPKHAQACFWLFAATSLWGLSFPLIKAILEIQSGLLPGEHSFFLAALNAAVRFAGAGLLIALFGFRSLRGITRLEWEQGLGLSLFGGLGILFQMDGLAHTPASTSAFLTQFYCLLLPVWVALRQRAWPRFGVMVSSVLVLVGVGFLGQFSFHEFKLGRGEAETLLSTFFFAGQILMLENPRYAPNRVTTFTVVMFLGITALLLPVAAWTAPSLPTMVQVYQSSEVLVLVSALTLLCTIGAYVMMNVWQPFVSATEAGLIYCVEPLCTSLYVLFLPGWLSQFAGIAYANESLTRHLLLGGTLITAANVLMQVEAMLERRKREARPAG